jgi:hypothetical protein
LNPGKIVTSWQKKSIFTGNNNYINISMASVRQLKKDIDNQLFEIISDCLLYVGLHPEKKSDEISAIIEDTVSLRNDLIARTNNPDGKDDPKIVRKHYQLIISDLNSGVDTLCKRLSALSSKKKK